MSAARNYARALFEATKEANGKATPLEEIEGQLAEILSWKQHAEAWSLLTSPVTSADEKDKLVRALCEKASISAVATRFVALMAKKNRLRVLADVLRHFKSVRLESEGGVLGAVDSAEALSESDLADLSKAFGTKLGRKVEFVVSVEPELLAGLRVKVDGKTYDGTLRSRLNRLRDQVVHGAATIQ